MQAHETYPQNRLGDSAANGQSAADLLRELRDEMTRLLRQEVALAKTEMSEKASRLTRNVVYVAIGGVVAFAGVIILLLAAVAGVYVALWAAAGVPHATAGWLAPLIVGGVVAVVGYVFIQKAINTFKHESLVPERTVNSLVQDKEWIKEKVQ